LDWLLALLQLYFIFSLCWCLIKYPKASFDVPLYIFAGVFLGEIATFLLCYEIRPSFSEYAEDASLNMLLFIPAAISAGVGAMMLLLIWIKDRQHLPEAR
jgi:hypothetical protein